MDFRGVHFALPPKDQVPFLKNLVKYVFITMRYNAVILEIAGAMRYDNFPEISERWHEACVKYEQGEWPIPPHYGFVSRDRTSLSSLAAPPSSVASGKLAIVCGSIKSIFKSKCLW